MVDRVREAVLRASVLRGISPAWQRSINRAAAYSGEALTMAAFSTQTGWAETATAISREIGK